MLTYRKQGLRFNELWYGEQPDSGCFDVLIHCQAPARIAGVECKEKRTIVLDLTRDEAMLLSDVKKDTRNEIRRAGRDGVTCEQLDGENPVVREAFYDYYDDFARAKGLNVLVRSRLEQIASRGGFSVTTARNAAGQVLVYHAYLCYHSRARLLFSASGLLRADDSAERNLIGRANRLLHWDDVCRFRAQGIEKYDFGGWYAGSADADRLRINKFKEEFGGQILTEFNAMHGVTIRGKLGVKVWNMLKGG